LYALRGAFYAGNTDSMMKYLHEYSTKRLVGEHVPYAIEAWPEGNQRHLAAESGLYCRAVTEGLFGIRPTGFNKFLAQPLLPAGWKQVALKNMHAFQQVFDMTVTRRKNGHMITIRLENNKTKQWMWDGKKSPGDCIMIIFTKAFSCYEKTSLIILADTLRRLLFFTEGRHRAKLYRHYPADGILPGKSNGAQL